MVFRRVLGLSAMVAMLWTGLALAQEKGPFTAERHQKRGVACVACHGVAQPKEPASAKACLACHKSLEAVAERTAGYEKNPHNNHMTQSSDLECTQCHQGHKADTPICHQCHEGMKFEKPQAEAK